MVRFFSVFARGLFLLAAVTVLGASSSADDWPQWMGPTRDGVWREQEIVQQFPAGGLPVRWRVPTSYGYSGPAIANGRVYVMDYVKASGEVLNSPDGITKLEGQERVRCLDLKSGEVHWEHAYSQPYALSYAAGPRCTPTVADGRVFAYGAHGKLTCLDAATGELVWRRDLPEQFGTKTPIWGYASHPLVVGDLVITLVGGPGSVCVALDTATGKEMWRALDAPEPGYGTPTLIEHAGVSQLLIWHPLALAALQPETGKGLWSVPLKPGYNMSIMGPPKLGSYLYASAIGDASALLKLDDDQPGADVVWRGKRKTSVYCSNSTPQLVGDMIYGCDVETGALVGAELATGKRLWQTTKPTDNNPRRSRHATAYLVRHEDRFFLFNELGDLILARLSREGYEELGRFHVLEPTNEAFGRPVVWSHPAFAGRCLVARNDEEIVCVDLAAE